MLRFRVHADYEPAGDQQQAIDALIQGVKNGFDTQTLKGVTGSGKTFTMAKVIEGIQIPTLVLSHNKTLAAQLYREFKSFFPDNAVEYFVSYYDYYQPEAYVPAKDLYIEKDSSINEEIDRMRLSATSALMERSDVIIVATVSCIYGLGNPVSFKDMRIGFSLGEAFNHSDIFKQLVRMQYERNDAILKRGGFRVRGDIMEIQPAYMKDAYRIQLDWDEIMSITKFDPVSGERLEEADHCMIYPAKHFVIPEEQVRNAIDDIRRELDQQYEYFIAEGKLLEAERIKTRTEYDIEMLQEMGYCSGIENYSRPLSGREEGERPAVLLDYFPKRFMTFIDEAHVTVPQIGAMYEGDRSRKTNLVNFGFRLPSALDNRPLRYQEFDDILDKRIFVSATPRKAEMNCSAQVVEQIIRPTGLLDPEITVRPTRGQIEDLYGEIRKRVAKDERILITTLTKKMSEDLTDYLAGIGVRVRYLHSEIETIERVEILRDLRLGVFDVLVGINLLREGLDLPEVSLVAILDADKIGFLRSATALIQTVGRASRNEHGEVIMYADKMSNAMEEAIKETTQRRERQLAYNKEHHITPKSVHKAVQDILLRMKQDDKATVETDIELIKRGYNIIIPAQRKKLIRTLGKQMLEHAKRLEFEKAALIRDEIEELKGMSG